MAIYFGTAGADSFKGGIAEDAIDGAPSGDPSLDTGADTLRGGLGSDTIYGRAGADVLAGDGDWDMLYGGDGDDVLLDNASGGSLSGEAGNDTIKAVNGGAQVYDYLYIHGDDGQDRIAVTGTGVGGNGPAYLWGDNGDDTISGSASGDGIFGGNDNDRLAGNLGNDTIIADVGHDTLDGGAGADELTGGTGDDVYVVDDVNDAVVEVAGEGTDTVLTSLGTYALGENVERLLFTGSGDFAGTGNGLANILKGGGGNDSLSGGDGSDKLNGRLGADSMAGGRDNDTYYVDDLNDVVVEAAGEGTDTVITTLAAYTLGADVERLTFAGSGAFTGTGNGLANILKGGSGEDSLFGGDGHDKLNGGLGADSMAGGRDNDAYYVDDPDDVVVEAVNEGTDTVFTTLAAYTLGTNVERLTFNGSGGFTGTGNALANTLKGGDGDDSLFGDDGNDKLAGGAGADELTGGRGDDVFCFDRGEAEGDLVMDFAGNGAARGDRLLFSGYGTAAEGASFTALSATTWQVTSADRLTQEVITFANPVSLHSSDWNFV